MTPQFLVITTSRFERELRKLAARHPGLPELYGQVIDVLKTDPYNRSRQHAIKKLTAVPAVKVSTEFVLGASVFAMTLRVQPST